jgi:hypothetical protein
MTRGLRSIGAGLLSFLLGFALCGCRDGEPCVCPYLLPQTSPDNVLKNLQTSYKTRDIEQYAPLLADDFRFYIAQNTRDELGLPEFWTRGQDSLVTARMFSSPQVNDIRITIQYSPTPTADAAHPGWNRIVAGDEFLELEIKAQPGETEGITLVVDGQVQRFYFRMGRSPADTLSTSPTSRLFYLVEWVDEGLSLTKPLGAPEASEPSTWSRLKAMFLPPTTGS